MNKIEFQDGITKLNKNTMDTFQNNIEKGINKNNIGVIKTNIAIPENTNYTIPLYYKVGNNSLEIFYMGEKLVKDEQYIEVGSANAISNTIQFKDWGMSVPTDRIIEFRTKGDYNE
jgi:hypothetical protein